MDGRRGIAGAPGVRVRANLEKKILRITARNGIGQLNRQRETGRSRIRLLNEVKTGQPGGNPGNHYGSANSGDDGFGFQGNKSGLYKR